MNSTHDWSTTAPDLDRVQNKFSPKPLQPRYFVGRRYQVTAILEAGRLYDWQPKLISLRGPEKIGRTSLLRYVDHLAKTRGEGTNYAVAFKQHIGALSCPYVDLRLMEGMEGATESEVSSRFVDALANALGYPEISGSSVQLVNLMNRTIGSAEPRYVLLIDRAEVLLQAHILQSLHGLLGALNEGVPGLSLLFSFGTSGDLNDLDAVRRALEIDDCIAAISSLLLNAPDEKIDVGLLRPDEISHFLQDDWHTQAGEPVESPFSASEIEWIQIRTGGHPAVLQLTGHGLLREKLPSGAQAPKEITEEDLHEVESFVLSKLKRLIAECWKRLDPLARDVAAALAATREGVLDMHDLPASVVRNLEGEGLVRPTPHAAKLEMPSSLVRELIRGYVEAADFGRIHSMGAREREETRLVVRAKGASHFVGLTDIEVKILDRLLHAPADGIVRNEDLYLAIWGRVPTLDPQEQLRWQQRLTQRIKGLRTKLHPIMGENPIKNVYGQGYRIIAPERFHLQSSHEVG